jgi:hypothetical protein
MQHQTDHDERGRQHRPGHVVNLATGHAGHAGAPLPSWWLSVTLPNGVHMSSTAEPEHLNNPHHRQTLLQTFQHPVSHNIEWHAMLSLLEAVGSVEVRHDGDYAVRIAGETAFLGRPDGKDLDVEQVLTVRRLLTAAGYGPVVEAMEAKGREV